MIKDQKAQILTEFLGSLPEGVAMRLAKAIELDRLSGGRALPHDLILDGLRPVLRRARPVERTATPLRLFCRPFEDLLCDKPHKEKLGGRIAHSSISPVWDWVSSTLLPAEAEAYSHAVTADVLGFRVDNALARAAEFYPLASKAILSALSTDQGIKKARTALGGDDVVTDAREMGLLLAIAPQVAVIQQKLPENTPALTDELLWALRSVYDDVVQSVPDAAPFVAVVAKNRLAKPWEAMRLPLAISRQTQDTLIASTDMGLVGEILFAEIEAHAVAIRSTRQPQFEVEDLVAHISAFATISLGMVKEVEIRRDGRWGARLLKDRAALAEVMDGFMKRAPKEILGALPTLKTGAYSGGPRIPDIAKAPDFDKCARAMRYARLIAGCRGFAAAASFGASLADAQDEINASLKSYCEDLLRELRTAEGARRDHAQHYLALAADVTALLLSQEEGEFLRRRGRAAVGTQAAA